MLHAVIMAGGSGTRFWPKSRRSRPKQLLNLFGDESMLQRTLARIAPLVPPERTWVVTGADQADAVRAQLPDVPAANVVGEPCPRDTAPCVGLAASWIDRADPDAVMVVLSADHVIRPDESFRTTVQAAIAQVERDPSVFVVFGVKPTRAETGYGYIEQGEPLGASDGVPLARVARFEEKPNRPTAEAYLASGRHLWNSGMFVWRARAVLDALARFQPAIVERLAAVGGPGDADALAREFPRMPKLPIDKAVMEQYENVLVLEVVYEWHDVGDWRSLAALLPRDDQGNATSGRAHPVQTRNSIIISDEQKPIVTLGLDDVVIVQSGGATLVARKDQLDRLKALVEGLDAAGLGDLL